jgi:signal transduction histidine kinase
MATASAAAMLSGCTAGDAGAAATWFASVALLAVGGLSAVLTAWVLRTRHAQALREAREALRRATLMQTDSTWRTNQAHQLVSWTAPGQAPSAHGALFSGQALETLVERLRSERAFSGLGLQTETAIQGNRTWQLSGVPMHDMSGAFTGFEGRAQAVDDWNVLRQSAATVPALLEACSGAALVVEHQQGAWVVSDCNAAARQAWADAAAGRPLDSLAGVGPDLVQAIDNLSPAAPTVALPGWRLAHAAGAVRRAVLVQQQSLAPSSAAGAAVPALAGAAAPTTSTDLESDIFSFTLSHDLRSPLRAVEGFTRIVKEDYGRLLDRVGNDHLDRVLGAAARMNLMIDALLKLADLSRQPLARQRVNLSQLANYVIDDLRRAAPERVVEVDIEPQLAAWGDPTLLRLVLENLLGNAWKYSGRCAQAQISLHQVPQGEGKAFVVRDNGAGFDMRSADRLFGLFQRLHSASDFPGHGVGLASVRRIVRRHGGDIWAEAEPGRGAAFYFTLAD